MTASSRRFSKPSSIRVDLFPTVANATLSTGKRKNVTGCLKRQGRKKLTERILLNPCDPRRTAQSDWLEPQASTPARIPPINGGLQASLVNAFGPWNSGTFQVSAFILQAVVRSPEEEQPIMVSYMVDKVMHTGQAQDPGSGRQARWIVAASVRPTYILSRSATQIARRA